MLQAPSAISWKSSGTLRKGISLFRKQTHRMKLLFLLPLLTLKFIWNTLFWQIFKSQMEFTSTYPSWFSLAFEKLLLVPKRYEMIVENVLYG